MTQNQDCCSDEENCKDYTEIFQIIHDIDKKFEHLQRREIKGEDLTPSQFFILRQLWQTESDKSDDLTFKDLALACNCAKSTVTGVVDTLEKKDLVKRVPNLKDRRSLNVKLTDKGKKLKNSTPTFGSLTENCCQGLNDEDLRTLTRLLKVVSSSLV